MSYQIVRMVPHFNNYDAISGYSYIRRPYAYSNKALAQKLCNIENYFGDEGDSFVIEYGGSVIKNRILPFYEGNDGCDGCPF